MFKVCGLYAYLDAQINRRTQDVLRILAGGWIAISEAM